MADSEQIAAEYDILIEYGDSYDFDVIANGTHGQRRLSGGGGFTESGGVPSQYQSVSE